MSERVYKIMGSEEWQAAMQDGIYPGSAVDIRDGFIHFSTASQVEETVAKHFGGQHNLVLVSFPATAFKEALKWEPSRGGDLFPHLYGALETRLNDGVYRLKDLPNGKHQFPKHF